MRLRRIAAGRQVRCLVLAGAGLLAVLVSSGPVRATALGSDDETEQPPDPMPHEMIETNAGFTGIERSDCRLENAVCRSECIPGASKQKCGADPCATRLMHCLATLPLGKSPSLPMACTAADQQAFRRLERQGELLNADPALFAESYRTLIRARIACRAGDQVRALGLYDEVVESMREKRMPREAPPRLGH